MADASELRLALRGFVPNDLLKPHAAYLALGRDNATRNRAYEALVSEAVDDDELAQIRDYLRQGRAWGGKRFQAHIESLHNRVAATRPRGRPSQVERK